MDGPVRAFMNRSTSEFFTVTVPDHVSLLGTRVRLITDVGESYTKEIIIGTGLLTDQTPDLVFGLGSAKSVEQVVILRSDGTTQTIDSPGRSITLTIEN